MPPQACRLAEELSSAPRAGQATAPVWAPPVAAAVPGLLCTDRGISLAPPRPGAQWTGIAMRIGERPLETGAVDAVLTMAPDPTDRWRPVPVLVTEAAGMAPCRGMGYVPLLASARAKGIKRLAVIGIPYQVYALPALERALGFERLHVVGTPCSDNTTIERFHQFLALLAEDPASITHLEFRADYHLELRFDDGRRKEMPFLCRATRSAPRRRSAGLARASGARR